MAAVETASAEGDGVLAGLDAPPEQRGWRWLLVGKALVAIATGVLAAGIWVVVLVEAEIERDRALERTHVDVSNLATAFGAHVERTLLGVDQMLVAIRSDVMRRSGSIDLSGAIESAPALRDLGAAVAVADATGRIVADNVGGVRPPVSIADRDYFRAHRAGGDRPMIGEPVISRLTQRCVITVSRPLFTENGTFDGVVIIAFLPDYLVNLYRQLEIGRSGAVALLGSDGVIWARVGPMPVDCGRQTPVRPGTTSLLSDGQARVVRSQIDGVDRIFAMRRVGQLPLWVTVGLGRDEVLEKTERETTRLTVFGAVATAGLVVFGLLLARDAERRRRAETALRRLNADLAAARATAEARTQQLAATMCHLRDGLSIYDSDHRLVLSNEAHRRLMDLPESLIQPGVSAHDVLRFRAARGDFGPCDPDEEERRRFETIVDAARQGLNEIRRMRTGRLIEMQRTVTPDGGFVSLYRDVTEH
ncbi:MAG: PAS-domain containing protein, partial [Alphaproteobacteria bacterium]